jgi:hypothetical protein
VDSIHFIRQFWVSLLGLLFLLGHLNLSCKCFDVAPRTDNHKGMYIRVIGAQNIKSILGLTINMIVEAYVTI